MFRVVEGSFPDDMDNAGVPVSLTVWANAGARQLKAVNAPFSVALDENECRWSVSYISIRDGRYHTWGGLVTELGNDPVRYRLDALDRPDFWMVLEKVKIA